MRFNYVFCFYEEYYRVLFEDKKAADHIGYIKIPRHDDLLIKLAFTPKLPYIVRFPFYKAFLYRFYRKISDITKNMSMPDKPICFVIHKRAVRRMKKGLYKMIKKLFPDSRVVLMLTDIMPQADFLKSNALRKENDKFLDFICTFNPIDAKKHGFLFVNVPTCDFSDRYLPAEEKYDVIFIGRKKDRLEQLYNIYNSLTRRGLRCSFILSEVSEEEKKDAPSGISFIDWISYDDYLKRISESRIILEISQKGSSGNTLRVNEAIVLGKKLISDNKALIDTPLYDKDNMFIYDDPEDIPDEFLFGKTKKYPEELKQRISLNTFIKILEENIDN